MPRREGNTESCISTSGQEFRYLLNIRENGLKAAEKAFVLYVDPIKSRGRILRCTHSRKKLDQPVFPKIHGERHSRQIHRPAWRSVRIYFDGRHRRISLLVLIIDDELDGIQPAQIGKQRAPGVSGSVRNCKRFMEFERPAIYG